MIKYPIIIFIFLLFITPIVINAQIVINEVMYSLEGVDDKHEWIEILNTGTELVDLTDWRFNDGSNHGLNIPPEKGGQGSIILSSGEYAILTGNADTFLSDHLGFSGIVIDTVMSLNNTQDTLSIKDADGITVDTVTYNSEQGADEDGNSLQLISGNWSVAIPTPGMQNESSGSGEESQQTEESSQSESSSSSSSSSSANDFPVEQQIFANAGGDRDVIVGADSLFEGLSLGLQKKPLSNARYVWNFGNGETKEGQNVLHYYQYPKEYVVTLRISSGQYSASDRIIVNAYSAELIISKVTKDFIELHNKSNRELNLSWWQLRSGSEQFMIPRDTIILPNKELIFSSEVTKLDTSVKENVSLLYPNGVEAFSFFQIKIPQKVVVAKKVAGEGLSLSAQAGSRNEVERGETLRSVTNLKKEKQVTEAPKEILKNTTQTASVILSLNDEDKKSGMTKWLLAIFGIIVISAGAVIFMGKPKKEDEIEIIE